MGRKSHWRPHSNYWGGRVPRHLGIAAHVCRQRKLNYLKLNIQTTNTKLFAVDNIITDFVFCPKILLHAPISQIPTTHFVPQNTVSYWPWINREAYSFWLCPWTPLGDSRPPDPLPRPPMSGINRHAFSTSFHLFLSFEISYHCVLARLNFNQVLHLSFRRMYLTVFTVYWLSTRLLSGAMSICCLFVCRLGRGADACRVPYRPIGIHVVGFNVPLDTLYSIFIQNT